MSNASVEDEALETAGLQADPESPQPPEHLEEVVESQATGCFRGRLHTAKTKSSGCCDFLRRFLILMFCGKVFWYLWILFLFSTPLSELIVGALFLYECPAEKYIPIYLIVAGCFGLLKAVTNCGHLAYNKAKKIQPDDPDHPASKRPNPVDLILNLFLLSWFIAGCIWIYGIGDFHTNKRQPDDSYCHPTLYWYAFSMQTTILFGICMSFSGFSFMCFLALCFTCRS